MRPVLLRPRIRFLAVVGAALTVAACRGEPGLPPTEVLSRSAHASQQLESALFEADAAVKGEGGMSGSLHAEGRLQDAGQQWDFHARLRMQDGAASSWDVTADVVVIDENEVYVRAQNVRANPPSALPLPLPAEALQRWLRLPSSNVASPPELTPDPKFLELQASVVQVTRDRGIVRLGDKRVYHYDVAVDPEKLRTFLREVADDRGEEPPEDVDAILNDTELTGQLWIDAEQFNVLRIQWTATALSERGYEGSLSVQLREHNAAPPIVPPEDAVPFEQLLAAPADLPPFLDAGALSPEEQRRLQELLDQ